MTQPTNKRLVTEAAQSAALLAKADATTLTAEVARAQAAEAAAVAKAGATMTGPLILSADPANALGAATRQYVLAKIAELTASAPAELDTFLEAFSRFTADEGALTALTGVVSGKQPLDDDLSAIASLGTTAFGRGLLTYLDAPAARGALGLGTAATQPASAFATAAQGTKADASATSAALAGEVDRATNAEAAKAPIASPTFTGTVLGITKTMVGLPLVDNTADAAKPVSTAQAAAITAAVNNLINSAPGILDTLGEIAAQLTTDESAVGALTAAVNARAPLANPALTGSATLNGKALAPVLYGTAAQRLALDPTTLPNPTLYISTDEAASLRIFVANGVTWSPGAAAGSHAERHIPGGADPLAWSTIHGTGTLSARPAAAASNANLLYFASDDNGGTLSQSNGSTWVPIAASVSVTNLIAAAEQVSHRNQADGYPGLVNGRLDAHQMPGYFYDESVPLAAAAVLTTNPRQVTGSGQVTACALGDQPFTLAIEVSTDGITFTPLAGSSVPATQFGTRYVATFTLIPTSAYLRGVLTNGASAQSGLNLYLQVTNVVVAPSAGSVTDAQVAVGAAIAPAKVAGLPSALSARLLWRGPWAASTDYAVNDLLIYNAGSGYVPYVVTTAFTSGATFDATNLQPLISGGGAGGGDGSPVPVYTEATLPAASSSNNTQLVYVSDRNGGTLARSNTSTWVSLGRGLTQPPVAHTQSHGRGGSDELVVLGGHRRDSSVESGPRWAWMTTGQGMTSQRVVYQHLTPNTDTVITKLELWSGTTAAAGLTLARIGLYTVASDATLTLVARTASDTTLFATASTQYQRALDATGGYPTTYTMLANTRYAIGVVLVGTTMPSLLGPTAGSSAANGLTPRLVARQDSQGDLPTPVPAGSLVNHTVLLYAAGIV